MACDAETLEALIATDKLPQLSDRDRLMCLAAIYGQEAGQNAQQALTAAYSDGFAKLSDRDLDMLFLSVLCQESCTGPLAPNGFTIVLTTTSSISVTWSQPAAIPPVLVDHYRVRWGTSSGNYNLGDTTIPGAQTNFSFTGLSPSETIFYIVQGFASDSCAGGISAEQTGTTDSLICSGGTTLANAWAARVVANGGAAPSQATKDAIANFQCGLISDGLDGQMISWNAFVSDNLIAAITPQLLGPASDPWTNHNFILADLTVSGLIGNSSNKYLDTGIPNFWGVNAALNAGVTVYVTTNTDPGGTEVITGCSNGGASLFALEIFGGNTRCFMFDVGSVVSAANAGFTGYVSVNRTALNAIAIYESNSGVAHHTLASNAVNNTGVGTTAPFNALVFAYQDNTGVALFSNHRLGFICYHFGLSSAQSALFSARVQTLMSALSRAI